MSKSYAGIMIGKCCSLEMNLRPQFAGDENGRIIGYVEDEFGPRRDELTAGRKSSSAHRACSGVCSRSSKNTRSVSGDLERRDVGSVIRRTLHKPLFKKKRKHKEEMLPDAKVRRAWADESGVHGGSRLAGPGSLTPLGSRGGCVQHSSLWAQRRTPGRGDTEHWQMYREGLHSDRKIPENLQEKLNRSPDRPFSPSGAIVDTDWEYGDDQFSEEGRLIIRERGCPKRQIQEYTGDMSEAEQGEDIRRSDVSLKARSMDGRCSQISSIDDNSLRRLLEELYKDKKKHFDKYMEKTEPKSEAIIHSRGLAEHGLGYLLERAEFWERRGPLPPRLPMTAMGWKMQREQTLAASRQASVINSTMTGSPDLNQEPTHMSGLIETPRENESSADKSASRDSLNKSVI